MFFLLRMAFWLGLVLVLMPFLLRGENVSMFDALGAMQAVVADARGFCDRQPNACAVGGQMVSHLTEQAQAGAKWLSDTLASHEAAPAPPANTAAPAAGLTPQDLVPAWGGGDKAAPASAAPQAPPMPAKRPS